MNWTTIGLRGMRRFLTMKEYYVADWDFRPRNIIVKAKNSREARKRINEKLKKMSASKLLKIRYLEEK